VSASSAGTTSQTYSYDKNVTPTTYSPYSYTITISALAEYEIAYSGPGYPVELYTPTQSTTDTPYLAFSGSNHTTVLFKPNQLGNWLILVYQS